MKRRASGIYKQDLRPNSLTQQAIEPRIKDYLPGYKSTTANAQAKRSREMLTQLSTRLQLQEG